MLCTIRTFFQFRLYIIVVPSLYLPLSFLSFFVYFSPSILTLTHTHRGTGGIMGIRGRTGQNGAERDRTGQYGDNAIFLKLLTIHLQNIRKTICNITWSYSSMKKNRIKKSCSCFPWHYASQRALCTKSCSILIKITTCIDLKLTRTFLGKYLQVVTFVQTQFLV